MPSAFCFPLLLYLAAMNYLAHAYCSFREPGWLVGNIISDFVKGKKQYDYPPAIHTGIRLHRLIDTFTDSHAAVQEAKTVFRPHYRLYAGAFVDVSFDYFVANDPRCFANAAALESFAQFTYQTLQDHHDFLPEKFQGMLHYMRLQNWLYHYRSMWGMEKSFGGVVRRSQHLTDSATGFALFQQHLPLLQACYNAFSADLWPMLEEWRLAQIHNSDDSSLQ